MQYGQRQGLINNLQTMTNLAPSYSVREAILHNDHSCTVSLSKSSLPRAVHEQLQPQERHGRLCHCSSIQAQHLEGQLHVQLPVGSHERCCPSHQPPRQGLQLPWGLHRGCSASTVASLHLSTSWPPEHKHPLQHAHSSGYKKCAVTAGYLTVRNRVPVMKLDLTDQAEMPEQKLICY